MSQNETLTGSELKEEWSSPYCPSCNSSNVHKKKKTHSWICYKCGWSGRFPERRVLYKNRPLPKYLKIKVQNLNKSKAEKGKFIPSVKNCYKIRCEHLKYRQTLHGESTKYKTVCSINDISPGYLKVCPLEAEA